MDMRPQRGEPGVFHVIDGDRPLDWERVYRDHVASIYRLLYLKVGNQHDAEDLTSQVFLEALPRLRSSASGGEIHTYLVMTARTTLAAHWRRRLGVQVTTIDENLVSAEGPAPAACGSPASHPPNPRQAASQLSSSARAPIPRALLGRETATRMGSVPATPGFVQYRALQRAAELGQEVGA